MMKHSYSTLFTIAVDIFTISHTALLIAMYLLGCERSMCHIIGHVILPMIPILICVAIIIALFFMQRISEMRFKILSVVGINLVIILFFSGTLDNSEISFGVATNMPFSLTIITSGLIGAKYGIAQWFVSSAGLWVIITTREIGTYVTLQYNDVFHSHIVNGVVLILFLWFSSRIASSHKSEMAALQAKADLEEVAQKSAFKSSYISHLTHELKLPLTVLYSASQLLLKKSIDEEVDKWHKVQFESCGLLRSLLDNVLIIHKIEANEQKLDYIAFSLPSVLEEVQNMLSVSASMKGIEFFINVDDAVPNVLYGDPIRVRQIIMNLASNAIRFTDDGYVGVGVSLMETRQMSKGDKTGTCVLEVRVEDTGIGMNESQQDSILQMGTQMHLSHTIDSKRGGTGLGLSIVNQLLNMMNGQLFLSSSIDPETRGSVFVADFEIDFEYGIDDEDSDSEYDDYNYVNNDYESMSASGSSETGRSSGSDLENDDDDDEIEARCVLLVEDNIHISNLISLHLEAEGHSVLCARNGLEGVEMFKEHMESIDIVLMDVRMPVMDGYEASEKITSVNRYDIPIIAMTAHSMESELRRCFDSGCSGYLSKPVDLQDLILCMDTLGKTTKHFDF